MIEVHPDPKNAVSDGKQSLKPETFAAMIKQVTAIAEAMDRRIAPIKKPVVAGW
jgi:3-deoxy-7-phosphoheptulonate synthase